MSKVLLAILVTALTLSCSKTSSELVGKWRLVELLADPGDGSGKFRPVSSKKVLEFYSDGTLKSNGEICFMNQESNTPTTGTYSMTDSTIAGEKCKDSPHKITFEKKGTTLILNFPCIEPCRAKYRKE
ncbi:hypothetical protein [Parapedobacter sp. 10938]|uniref:hypothetical protein n=1 Tax=Parapedobacter flavus TaxID=3110225 RepID=UPI002DBE76C5|nr:hypothetical protein [Parapedobacter sp. 10938]MEC3881619.1 hypothetical protein [Parapedobacter sp. 10938]